MFSLLFFLLFFGGGGNLFEFRAERRGREEGGGGGKRGKSGENGRDREKIAIFMSYLIISKTVQKNKKLFTEQVLPSPRFGKHNPSSQRIESTPDIFPPGLGRLPRPVPGLVEARVVGAEPKEVDTVRGPGDGGNHAGKDPAQGFPAVWGRPCRASPGFVEELIVGPEAENIQPIGAPRHGIRGTTEDAPEVLPTSPLRPVPCLVEHVVIGAEPEEIQSIRTPTYHLQRTGKGAAE